MDTLIRVLYGPYEAHGIIRHRIQKLYGIIEYLEEKNMNYEIQPISTFNRFTIEMGQRIVFACDIRFLKFNINYADDSLCMRTIDAIQRNLKLITVEIPPKFPDVPREIRWEQVIRSDYDLYDQDDTDMNVPYNSLDNLSCEMSGEQFDSNYENYILDNDDSKSLAETTSSVSISPSCGCLSADTTSYYSICYGPVKTKQYEKDNVKRVTVSEKVDQCSRDLNEQLNITLNESGWDILKYPPTVKISNRSSHLGETEMKDEIGTCEGDFERIFNNNGYADDDSAEGSDPGDSEPTRSKSAPSGLPGRPPANITTTLCNVWKKRGPCKRYENIN